MNASPWLNSRAVPAICPKCNAPALLRSHAQSRLEHKRKQMTGKRPWRCHVCDWRGWFDETALQYPASAKKPLPPEIAGSDVPIPDLDLEENSMPYGIPTTMKEFDSDGNSGSIEAKPAARSSQARKNLSDFRKQSGETGRFSVFGIEVTDDSTETREAGLAPEHEIQIDVNQKAVSTEPLLPIDENSTVLSAELNEAAEKDAPELPSDADCTNAAAASTETGEVRTAPTRIETVKNRGTNDDDMTGQPVEFSEESGKPVSIKVGAAFHHEARNKSWSCPKCSEFALYRSRARTMREILKKQFTKKRPYRCHRCGWRGWMMR
ncbi:MAG: hypothetical protein WBQ23_12640 [Bacteroidota bacterium]